LKDFEFDPITEEKEEETTSAKNNLSFKQKIKQLHNDFNYNLQQLLTDIINQQNDHYSGKLLDILYRYSKELDYSKFD